ETREWYEKAVEENCKPTSEPSKEAKPDSRKKKTFWISLCSSLAAACIIIISILVFHPSPTKPPQKRYLIENQNFSEIESFDSIRGDIQNISIQFGNIYTPIVQKVYDSESNDTLYYTIELNNEDTTYERMVLEIYVNRDFHDRKSLSEVTGTETVNGLNVRYYKKIVVDDWANQIIYNAVITYKNTEIYIDYKQYSLDESSNFFNFIEQTIRIADNTAA
ncbi:MAG: hypothetical protein K2M95_00870, partial [Clostridiales bacterium]|nr:hypothetical protein [Clostridiales bacterium]